MARHVAANLINHDGVEIQPGEALTGFPEDLLAHWVEMGVAEVLENMEPSLQDTQEVWAAFAVEQEMLTAEQAAELSKEELVMFFMNGELPDEAFAPQTDDEPETSDETPAGDDPENDDSTTPSDEGEDASPTGDADETATEEAGDVTVTEPSGGEEE